MVQCPLDNEPIELEIVAHGGMHALLDIIKTGAERVFIDKCPEEFDDAFLALQLLSSIVECGMWLKGSLSPSSNKIRSRTGHAGGNPSFKIIWHGHSIRFDPPRT